MATVRPVEVAAMVAGVGPMYLKPAPPNSGRGVTVNDVAASQGYTFVNTKFAEGFCPALLDAQGSIVSRLEITCSDGFPDPPKLDFELVDLDTVVHGAEVIPNGRMLNWPGYGPATLDRRARIRRADPRITHHEASPIVGQSCL